MTVEYSQQGGIATIRMDDGKANALSYAMMEELEKSLDRAQSDGAAVVLTGRAGRFCAGFDLREMTKGLDNARALVSRGVEFYMKLYTFPAPLVVACSGHALAGGALVVLTGDVRVGAQGAFRVGLNEVQIGMPVPILAMELARDRLTSRALTEATLFARIYSPDEAQRAGYLDQVVPEGELLAAATREATRLAELPRGAYAKTKIALRERTVAYIRDTLAMDMARLTPPVS